MKVYGEAALTAFARKYAASRKPLQRFLAIARLADWPHFPSVKQAFPATGYAPSTGTLIFDIGGNKFRVVARVDFEEQVLYLQSVPTHEGYDREDFRCPPRLMNSF
jgi:mRNA interferase HigB